MFGVLHEVGTGFIVAITEDAVYVGVIITYCVVFVMEENIVYFCFYFLNTGVYDVGLEVLVNCAGDFVEVFFGTDFGEGVRVEWGFFRFGFGNVLLYWLREI